MTTTDYEPTADEMRAAGREHALDLLAARRARGGTT